ncbi:hypothetical protein B0H21DRAFT_729527 [Amylocystis lapponica]|nr:hypothetical protein B0H21DRAFT_729527 [Amylocystis lapponica]
MSDGQNIASVIKSYLSLIGSVLAGLWAFIFHPIRTIRSSNPRRIIRRLKRRVRILRAAFDKTPQEYAEEAFERSWATRCHSDDSYTYPGNLPYKPPPPPGTVRVRWFPYLEAVLPGKHEQPDLYADVMLEPNGDLDLRILKRLWGLENCIPVDWVRLKLFYPGNPDRLSHVAVQLLSADQEHCLRIVECPSWERLDGRELREWVLGVVDGVREYVREERRLIAAQPHFLRDTALGILAWVLIFAALSPILRILFAAACVVGAAVISAVSAVVGAVTAVVNAVVATVTGAIGAAIGAAAGVFIAVKAAVVGYVTGAAEAVMRVPEAAYAKAVAMVVTRLEAAKVAVEAVSHPVVVGIDMVCEGMAVVQEGFVAVREGFVAVWEGFVAAREVGSLHAH